MLALLLHEELAPALIRVLGGDLVCVELEDGGLVGDLREDLVLEGRHGLAGGAVEGLGGALAGVLGDEAVLLVDFGVEGEGFLLLANFVVSVQRGQ